MTCITGRNASCPAPISTVITSDSQSRLSWPMCRHARASAGGWRLGRIVMAMTWRADAMLAHRRRTDLPHQMIILPRPCLHGVAWTTGKIAPRLRPRGGRCLPTALTSPEGIRSPRSRATSFGNGSDDRAGNRRVGPRLTRRAVPPAAHHRPGSALPSWAATTARWKWADERVVTGGDDHRSCYPTAWPSQVQSGNCPKGDSNPRQRRIQIVKRQPRRPRNVTQRVLAQAGLPVLGVKSSSRTRCRADMREPRRGGSGSAKQRAPAQLRRLALTPSVPNSSKTEHLSAVSR